MAEGRKPKVGFNDRFWVWPEAQGQGAFAHKQPFEAGYCFPIAAIRSTKHHTGMTITTAVLAQLQLSDVRAVIFYKRDEITADLI